VARTCRSGKCENLREHALPTSLPEPAGRIGARAVVHSYSYYFMLIFKGPHSYTCLGT
jgi:hypothetical protein